MTARRDLRGLYRVDWDHPHLGRVSETVCTSHDGVLLKALKALGIGCTSSTETERVTCDRCAHPGIRARVWLPERAQ